MAMEALLGGLVAEAGQQELMGADSAGFFFAARAVLKNLLRSSAFCWNFSGSLYWPSPLSRLYSASVQARVWYPQLVESVCIESVWQAGRFNEAIKAGPMSWLAIEKAVIA